MRIPGALFPMGLCIVDGGLASDRDSVTDARGPKKLLYGQSRGFSFSFLFFWPWRTQLIQKLILGYEQKSVLYLELQ